MNRALSYLYVGLIKNALTAPLNRIFGFQRSSESGDRSCRGVGGEAARGVGGEGEDGVDDGDLEDGSKNRKNQKIYNNSAIPSIR